MKLLFDENLSHKLPPKFADLYPDSQHVKDVGLTMAGDETVWAYAKQQVSPSSRKILTSTTGAIRRK